MIKKQNFVKFIVKIFSAWLILIGGVAGVSYGKWGKITEVAFDEDAPSSKYVEIFVSSNTNINGSKLYYRANLEGSSFESAFTFPDVDVKEGDYIILEFGVDDDPKTTKSWGYVFHTSDPDPPSSQGALYLTDPSGSAWEDFVLFIRETTENFYMSSEYDMAVSSGHWSPSSPENYRGYVPTLTDDDAGWSLQRKRDNVTGAPVDTDAKDDWVYEEISRGSGYFVEPSTIDDEEVIVYPNPFYPEEGQEARIVLPEDFSGQTQKLRIYTVDGVQVLEKDVRADMLSWDGKNKSGKDCASGLYFFYLETGSGGKTGKITLVR
ncbi:MAG: hypothetical protein ACQEQC_03255 [Elusimicrobiota bacterium]